MFILAVPLFIRDMNYRTNFFFGIRVVLPKRIRKICTFSSSAYLIHNQAVPEFLGNVFSGSVRHSDSNCVCDLYVKHATGGIMNAKDCKFGIIFGVDNFNTSFKIVPHTIATTVNRTHIRPLSYCFSVFK